MRLQQTVVGVEGNSLSMFRDERGEQLVWSSIWKTGRLKLKSTLNLWTELVDNGHLSNKF